MLHGIPFIRMAHTARTSQRPVLSEHRTSSVRAGVIRAATCRPHRLAVRQTWSTKVHAQRGAMDAQISPPPPNDNGIEGRTVEQVTHNRHGSRYMQHIEGSSRGASRSATSLGDLGYPSATFHGTVSWSALPPSSTLPSSSALALARVYLCGVQRSFCGDMPPTNSDFHLASAACFILVHDEGHNADDRNHTSHGAADDRTRGVTATVVGSWRGIR